MAVIDEKGVRHSHCHGVEAAEWFRIIHQVIIMLSSPQQRAEQGLIKIWPPDPFKLCDDPDCNRLNRRARGPNAMARYGIVRSMPPVRPIEPASHRERKLCAGHPFEVGNYLCEACARVAMAKRVIDSRRHTDDAA